MEQTTKLSNKPKSKTWKVTDVWSQAALNWPGHFGGALSLSKKKIKSKDPKKPLEMLLTTLDGWLLIKHDGALAVTNGVVICTIDETEDDAPISK